MPINILSETEASAKLGRLIHETASAHEPILDVLRDKWVEV